MLGVWSLIIWDVMWLYSLSYAFASVYSELDWSLAMLSLWLMGFLRGFLLRHCSVLPFIYGFRFARFL